MEHVILKKNAMIWEDLPKVHVQMVMEFVALVSINLGNPVLLRMYFELQS